MANFLSLLIFLIGNTAAVTLPDFVKKCPKTNPGLNACLDVSVVDAMRKLSAGNKTLGLKPLDPYHLKGINVSSSGSLALTQRYRNIKIYGLTGITVTDSDANFSDSNCYHSFNATAPFMRVESDYVMEGRILLFPINGWGQCNNTMYDIFGSYRFGCEKFQKKNRTHIRFVSQEVTIKPKRIVLFYDNIIDGNEQLSRDVLRNLNENAMDFYQDLGAILENMAGSVWRQSVNRVFYRVAEDDLFLT